MDSWRFTRTPDCARCRGMALFVTLVVVLILYVVVYQLWHSALLETKIAKNQSGYVKSAIATSSIIPYALALLQEDLTRSAEGSSTAGLSSLTGTGDASGASPSTDTRTGSSSSGARTGVAGLGEASTTTAASAKGGLYDVRKNSLFCKTHKQTINGVTVTLRIIDAERMINLNKLFSYVALWRKEKETVGKLGDAAAAAAADGGGTTTAGAAGDAAKKSGASAALAGASKEDADLLREALGEDAGLVDDALAQAADEWVEPDAEQVEAAVRMVADLIIHMVESNIESGFRYDQEYNADTIGRNIVEYVLTRKRDELQNYIYSTAELLQVDGVTPELFDGPLPLELYDPEYALDEGQPGYRRNEFGELYYDYGIPPEEMEQDPMREDLRAYMDNPEFRQFQNIGRGFMPGKTAYDDMGCPKNEDGTGDQCPRMPLGLKHVLCTFSNGKINLNTAPMEVLMALCQGGGDVKAWDAEMKLKIGRAIDLYLEGFSETYLQKLEDQANGVLPATEEETLDPYQDFQSMVASEDSKETYNYFTNIADLEKIEIDGEQVLKAGIDSGDADRSPATLLKKDLGPVAAFAGEYFNVHIKTSAAAGGGTAAAGGGDAAGETARAPAGEVFLQEADLVIHRDLANKTLSVIYYRERQD